jgi:hypothetical protein
LRLSRQQVTALQKLLKELHGIEYTDEETQQAGLAIMRFVLAKAQRNNINKVRSR